MLIEKRKKSENRNRNSIKLYFWSHTIITNCKYTHFLKTNCQLYCCSKEYAAWIPKYHGIKNDISRGFSFLTTTKLIKSDCVQLDLIRIKNVYVFLKFLKPDKTILYLSDTCFAGKCLSIRNHVSAGLRRTCLKLTVSYMYLPERPIAIGISDIYRQ